MTTSRVTIIGGGHMGLAIARGLVRSDPPVDLCVVETNPDRRAVLTQEPGFTTAESMPTDHGALIVLAVPPQQFSDFAATARARFRPDTPVLSVMAGLTVQQIKDQLGTAQVVRSIPNTPSEVFYGMTVYYADAEVQDSTIAATELLLTSIGQALRVFEEKLIDDATALCGGGPAFISYIADSFCKFALSRGFTQAQSLLMTTQVFRGTAELIGSSNRPPMQLCQEVMTPQGTTERGIAKFDEYQLPQSLVAALTASADRSRELSAQWGASALVRPKGA